VLVQWATGRGLRGDGRRALVVGCGPGYDAEYVAGLGFRTVAFDIAASAVAAARRRFPDSPVEYVVADLLDPPAAWREAFELVVESYNVQSLPKPRQHEAIRNVRGFVAPGGTLVVIAVVQDDGAAPGGPPWPLTRAEVESFVAGGLSAVQVDEVRDAADPAVGRWVAEFRRAV
jgi:SAM-dependent methyltransferase